MKLSVPSPASYKGGVRVNGVSNYGILEVEEGTPEVQGNPWQHAKFNASLNYMRSYLRQAWHSMVALQLGNLAWTLLTGPFYPHCEEGADSCCLRGPFWLGTSGLQSQQYLHIGDSSIWQTQALDQCTSATLRWGGGGKPVSLFSKN